MTQKQPIALTLPARLGPGDIDYCDAIAAALAARRATLDTALAQLADRCVTVAEVAARLVETLRGGRKVLVAGNGGSAAEAQHFAAELVGRFKRERAPYAVLSLTTDTSILTAIANDYAYEDVFARQVSALGRPGDLLIGFSTSGESENLLRAAMVARQRRVVVVALTGFRPSALERLADLTVRMPVGEPGAVQELHKIITHILCDIVESELVAGEDGFGP